MFAFLLSSCRRYNASFKLDQLECSLFMTVRYIVRSVKITTHDFVNASLFPGVNTKLLGGISTLAPGIRPERRSAPLARGLALSLILESAFKMIYKLRLQLFRILLGFLNNSMHCSAMQCNAMQCNAMQCNAMQCNAMQCNAMQCNATLLYHTD